MDVTYQLICEGPCNPSIPELDARVEIERRENASEKGVPGFPSPETTDELRLLRHTPHVLVKPPTWAGEPGSQLARCCQCGTVRAWG